jgi:hypothetical protein
MTRGILTESQREMLRRIAESDASEARALAQEPPAPAEPPAIPQKPFGGPIRGFIFVDGRRVARTPESWAGRGRVAEPAPAPEPDGTSPPED